jgi:hypothetical protein
MSTAEKIGEGAHEWTNRGKCKKVCKNKPSISVKTAYVLVDVWWNGTLKSVSGQEKDENI